MKNKRSSIHPELQTIARLSPKFSFSGRNLWLMKGLINLLPGSRAPDLRINNVFIPGVDGQTSIRLRTYIPISAGKPLPALLWLHGGGYVMGKPEMDDSRCLDYARRCGMAVVSVDYRCAPQHPFPAALQDCTAALLWVNSHAEELGLDARRIAVGGESAGGGLAAALVQLAHDRLEVKPVFQLLVYPMLDDRTARRTDIDDSLNLTWDQNSNRFGWRSYLGDKYCAADVPAYAVPARRADLSGLPPAWIGVGSVDIFHAEDVAYAHRLQACGVACELMVVPGAFHGFDVFNPRLPVVQAFRQSQISSLKNVLS